jgi:hypothetical protein
LLLFTVGWATSASAAAQTNTHWRATGVTLPANAATGKNRGFGISSISCASPGNCAAVGSYYDSAGVFEGLLLTEKAGHWAAGVEAVAPANKSFDPWVNLASVSCASAGNCTAVGSYINSSEGSSGLLLTETAGRWGAGVEAVLPADDVYPEDDNVQIYSVSCASAGNCIAVGNYDYFGQGLLLTEKVGQWGRGVEAPFPADAHPGLRTLDFVSCSSDGGCSAVGSYNITASRDAAAGEGALLTEEGGIWRAVKALMPPDGPGEGTLLTSVSCASAGNCGAIGQYNINIDGDSASEGVLLTENSGHWQRGVTAMPPKHLRSAYWGNYVGLSDISCSAPGDCVAAGDYVTRRGEQRGTLLIETGGEWRRGVAPVLPVNPEAVGFTLSAVSCASKGNCTAVGSYTGVAGHPHGLLLTEIAGNWARGVTAPHSIRAGDLVSCASAGNCGAIGYRRNAVLLGSTTAR